MLFKYVYLAYKIRNMVHSNNVIRIAVFESDAA